MAKQESVKDVAKDLNLPPAAPPTGWDELGSPDIDGWWRPAVGSVIAGKLVGRLHIEDDDNRSRDVVLVKLEYDCPDAVMNRQSIVLRKGQVLGVGVREKLRDVLSYVEHRGNVWIRAIEQSDIGGGKTLWKFDVRCHGRRSAPPEPEKRKPVSDELPF